MSFSPSSPLTGASQADLTSPTYTLTSDTFPGGTNGEQYAVTALGGTQTGVTTHTVSSPFTIAMVRPKTLKGLGMPNAAGNYPNVPVNVYKLITRKGVTPAADQPERVATVITEIRVPAGSELYDHPEVQAMLSAHIGCLDDQSSGIGDITETGTL